MNGSVNIVPPAIDPLAPKNMALSPEDASYVCDQFGIDVDRPLMCQVSRFDPWKDPLGRDRRLPPGHRGAARRAARARRLDGDRRPRGLGLLQLDGRSTPTATPTSTSSTTSTTSARSRSTPSSRRPTSLIQKSTREGFGLTVSEALWKGRPFVGGNVGGIPLQVEDGDLGLPRRHRRGVRRPRRFRSSSDPGLGKSLGRARQGARAPALPDAAAAARLAADLHRHHLRAPWRPSPPLVLVSNRGPVTFEDDGEMRRGGGGLVTALTGPGLPPRRGLDRLGDDPGRTSQVAEEHDDRPFAVELPGRRRLPRCASSRSDDEAYDRFYNVFANPMLWFIQHYLWDLSNAPDIRRHEVEAFEFGYNVVNEDLARAVLEEIDGREQPGRDGPRLPPLHAAGARAPRAAGRLPAPLRPHPVDPAGRLARAARADPRRDLRRDPLQRHHRLPHARLPAQLPAVLPRPDGLRGRLRARASCTASDREVWVRAYPLPIDARATRAVAERAAYARVRARAAAPPARVPDPARRPRGPRRRTCCAASPPSTSSSSSTRSSASASRSSPSSCRRGPTCRSTPSTSSASRRSSRSSTTATARRTGCRSSSSCATTSRRRSPPTSTTTCCSSTRCSTA